MQRRPTESEERKKKVELEKERDVLECILDHISHVLRHPVNGILVVIALRRLLLELTSDKRFANFF